MINNDEIKLRTKTLNNMLSIKAECDRQVVLYTSPSGGYIIARFNGKRFMASISKNATVKITHNKNRRNINKTDNLSMVAAIKFITDANYMYR